MTLRKVEPGDFFLQAGNWDGDHETLVVVRFKASGQRPEEPPPQHPPTDDGGSVTTPEFDAIASKTSPERPARAIGARRASSDDYHCPGPDHHRTGCVVASDASSSRERGAP